MGFFVKLKALLTPKEHSLRQARYSLPVLDSLPTSVDLRSQMTPHKDQKDEGCCGGEGGSAYAEFYNHLTFWLSEAYVYAKTRIAEGTFPADSGVVIADVMAALNCWGAPPEGDLPFEDNAAEAPTPQSDQDAAQYKIGEVLQVRTDDDGTCVKTNLAAGKLVVIGFEVYQNFFGIDSSGLMPAPEGDIAGGHCVVVVGYQPDTDGSLQLIVRNSWGSSWALRGDFLAPWSIIAPLINEAWTSE